MKTLVLLLTTFLSFYSLATFSQAGEWTWEKGSTTAYATGSFGTQGAASPTNTPAAFYEPMAWTDTSGNFWLFGGAYYPSIFGSLQIWGDLWEFNPTNNEWTWVKGTGQANATGDFGVEGTPSPNNLPPGLCFSAATWVDHNNDLWMYGGEGYDGGMAAMWRYNIATNTWTWMAGSSAATVNPVFGTMGVEAAANTPGSRYKCQANWVDSTGNLWLYGGTIKGSGSYNNGYMGDLWRYDITTNYWSWMGGIAAVDSPEISGVKGVAAATNFPGGRNVYSSWTDASNNFWMLGGLHNKPVMNGGFIGVLDYNDVWEYQPATGNWTWVSGTHSNDDAGNYGAQCTADTGFNTTARYDNLAHWKDACGNFWFYGGLGINLANDTEYSYSDLWSFSPVTLQWVLENGNSTSEISPVYGTEGAAAAGNTPGGRGGAVSWYSKSGQLYLFGGGVYNSLTDGAIEYFNDMWMFTVDPSCGNLSVPVTLNLGNDTSYCGAFTRTLTSGYNNAVWSTGAIGTQITVSQPGTYWASVAGCGGIVSDTIVLSVQNLSFFNLGADTTYCGNFSRTLATGNDSTVWSTGDTAAQITVTNPGTYWAVLSSGCGFLTDTIHLAESNLAVQLDSVNASCGQSTGSVSVMVNSGTAPYSYEWNTNSSSDTITNLSAGTYTVTVTDHAGCMVITSAQVSSSGSLTLQTDTMGTSCGIDNGSAWINPTSGTAPYSYHWNTGSGNDTITNLAPGTYLVTVTDNSGCSAAASAIINSSSIDSINLNSPNPFCQGDSVTICAPSDYPAYAWNTGESTACITVSTAGNYYVTVTETGGCSVTSNHVSITVLPAPSVSLSISGDTLTAFNAVAYQWYLNDSLLPGDTAGVLIATQSGTYAVQVTGTNGCSSLSNGQLIKLTEIGNLQEALRLKLYPDPASNELNVSYSLNEPANLQITITDVTGKLIQNVLNEKELSGTYLQHIQLNDLASGVYILNFISDKGFANLRFVKE